MLHVISTPIGNFDDLSPRAAKILSECDYVICEEIRTAETLLKKIGVRKECLPLNEHNETKVESDYLRLLLEGKTLALISDCGTPLVSDPGNYFLNLLHSAKIKVSPVPGPCSVSAALSVSGFDVSRYFFAGFPHRDKNQREQELRSWSRMTIPVVIMDTPFRLHQLLESTQKTFGKKREACLCVSMTLPNETILHGTVEHLRKTVLNLKKKQPFVLILDRC